MNRLLAGAAEEIQLKRRRFNGISSLEAGHAADVGALFAGRGDATADDVFDVFRVQRDQRLGKQGKGMDAVKGSVRFSAPNGSADGIYYKYIHLCPHSNQEIQSGQ